MRVIWLDENISPIDTPEGTIAKLLGVYDSDTQYTTIYLVIDHKGTEYRISRYHKRTSKGSNPERLERQYSRTIQTFIRKYGQGPFTELIEKFLSWSDNPAHEVLREFLPQTEPIDT